MDPTRFDALTRFLATRPSRRVVLRGLTGGLTAGLLGRQAVADDCKAVGKACSKASQCCSGLCAPPPSGHTSVAHSGSVCCATGQVIDPGGACCTPDPKATTCAGTCGTVTNNCGQSVDCGSCCAGKICPSPCECLSSGNGTFCYSGRFGGGFCTTNADCTVAGTSCQKRGDVMQCLPIDCTGGPTVCPTGSQCTGGTTCRELCTAS